MSPATWAQTTGGPFRSENQDRVVHAEGRTVVVGVVDGMGGGVDGALAAELVAATLARLAEHALEPSRAREALDAAHEAVCAERDRRGHLDQMGAVATVFWLDPQVTTWPWLCLHVGDARGFAFSPDGSGRQLTRDQSAIDYGELPDAVALTRPLRNYVAAALGTRGGLEPQLVTGELAPGSSLLAASDGVGDFLSRVQLAGLVAHRRADEQGPAVLAAALDAQEALQRGDNVAVAVLQRPYLSAR